MDNQRAIQLLQAHIDAEDMPLFSQAAGIGIRAIERVDGLEKELAEARAELAEARKDRERYQYIRTESLICWSQGKMKNLISWPTIRAVDRINGGNYRDRFDAAIDSARAREGKG